MIEKIFMIFAVILIFMIAAMTLVFYRWLLDDMWKDRRR